MFLYVRHLNKKPGVRQLIIIIQPKNDRDMTITNALFKITQQKNLRNRRFTGFKKIRSQTNPNQYLNVKGISIRLSS